MTTRDGSAGTPVLETEAISRVFEVRRGILGRRRAGVRAVDGVNLTIQAGETLGLVGESGSGKSTVARIIARLIEPTEGAITVHGRTITRRGRGDDREIRRATQMVFQDPYSSFDPTATISNSLAEPLRVHTALGRAEREERVHELLGQVGLTPAYGTRRPAELSGGQLQRAAVARALAPDPSLLVLDEPVSALDLSTQAQVVNLLGELQRDRGISYLFISHDLSVVRHVSDRIAVMYLGRVVEQGPAEVVYARPCHPYTAALLSAIPTIDARQTKKRQRILLEGEIPSPTAPPSGCRFHTRCPWTMEVCRTVDPPAFTNSEGVVSHCHLHTLGPALSGSSVRTLASEGGRE